MLAASTIVLLACATMTQPQPNTLSPADQTAGWMPLFDGTSTQGWRSYRGDSFPAQGWVVEEGTLRHVAGAGGGDIVSLDQFADFEFAFDFKCAPKANSGVMYLVEEKHDAPWMTGPEFQVLDDAGHALAPSHKHSAGALYDIFTPPDTKKINAAGEWNSARIRMRNGVLQHFLNGSKTVEARLFDDNGAPAKEWIDHVAASKFKDYAGFGMSRRGHIALQDHGDDVWFRNLYVRDLNAPMPGEVTLLSMMNAAHGKEIPGWECVVPELSAKGEHPGAPWSIKDGVLRCGGNPAGYIRTTGSYTNFVLKLEWRFPDQPGNSGVLVRMIGPDKVWPKSIEAQLHSGNAGDFWNIDDFTMTTDPARTRGRNTKKTHAAERPVGEWNEYEIIVNKGDVIVRVNGEELNRATNVEEIPGKICLQSEGAVIEFRRIRLVNLD
ncbi:MAG: DUF1080 domain-containing protein [Phycisphaerales bacterium]|nr:DUF1080 domain-containing protein [Phycisphaerales bacterium]